MTIIVYALTPTDNAQSLYSHTKDLSFSRFSLTHYHFSLSLSFYFCHSLSIHHIGAVTVTRILRREREDGPLFYGKREFSARGVRMCNALAFNPVAPHLLAGWFSRTCVVEGEYEVVCVHCALILSSIVGLEKAGKEPSLVLWDLTSCHSR